MQYFNNICRVSKFDVMFLAYALTKPEKVEDVTDSINKKSRNKPVKKVV